MNKVLIPPLLILIVAIIYRIFLPKKINWFYGYRTKSSMKNQDTWDEANRFSANLLLVGSIACLLFVMLCVIFIYGREMQTWVSVIYLFCMLLGVFLITEWHLSKLFDKSDKRIRVFGTIVLMTIIFIPLAWLAYPCVVQILSGQIFARHFNPDGYGSASEPIGIAYALFTFFSAAVLPYVAVVRWISIRKTQLEYWTFALLTIIVCLCLISFLTGGFYNLLLYIHAMGYTPKSMLGLLYGLGGYILILGFLYWAIRKPK